MGLDSATNNATRMLGPLLGGVLLASLGLGGVYVLSVILYAAALLCIVTLTFSEKIALEGGPERETRIGLGRAIAREFTWEATAEGLLAVYSRLLDE